MNVGDRVVIWYKPGREVATERSATVTRLTKTLVVVVEDGRTRERRFRRESGHECVPGGGTSHDVFLRRPDGTSYYERGV